MLGEDVAVLTRRGAGEDEMGEPVWEWDSEVVHGVLVRSVEGSELTASDTAHSLRPDGLMVQYVLAFPRSWTESKPWGHLEHARVALVSRGMDASDAGSALRVAGRPDRTPESPLAWDTIAEVGRMDG